MMNESFHTLLCEFAASYPEVRVQVHSSSQLVDLQRDGYDVAIRASSHIEPGLIARTLSRQPLLAVASPAYLEQHGVPRTRRDLRSHRCLMGFARGALPESHWSVSGGGKLHVEGSFFSNDVALLASAALRGLGIAFLPLMLVHARLESGPRSRPARGHRSRGSHRGRVPGARVCPHASSRVRRRGRGLGPGGARPAPSATPDVGAATSMIWLRPAPRASSAFRWQRFSIFSRQRGGCALASLAR